MIVLMKTNIGLNSLVELIFFLNLYFIGSGFFSIKKSENSFDLWLDIFIYYSYRGYFYHTLNLFDKYIYIFDFFWSWHVFPFFSNKFLKMVYKGSKQ